MKTPETSLDRFLRERGNLFLGRSTTISHNRLQRRAGVGMFVVGMGIMVLPVFGVTTEVMYGAAGPILAGIVNLSVAHATKPRKDRLLIRPVVLTPEAKALIGGLVGERSFGVRSRPWPAAGELDRSSQTMDPATLDFLEAAAHAHNRISALEDFGAAGPSLGRLLPKIVNAANEAMAEVLHLVAVSARYPEASSPAHQRLKNSVARMNEIADRASRLAESPNLDAGKAETIDSVLEELRFEALARQELVTDPAETRSELA
jgi:hypothetical protein